MDQLSNILFVPPFLPRSRRVVDVRTLSYKRPGGFICKALDAGDLPVLDYLATPETVRAFTQDGSAGHGGFSLFEHVDHPAQAAYLPASMTNPPLLYVLDPPRKRIAVWRGSVFERSLALGADFAAITPTGVEVTATRIFVAAPTKLFAFDHNMNRVAGEDVAFVAAQRNPAGVKFYDDHFYVPDSTDNKLYAYQPDGTNVPAREFAFHADNANATDIDVLILSEAPRTIHVAILDGADKQTYTYQPDGTRDQARETSFAAAHAARGPRHYSPRLSPGESAFCDRRGRVCDLHAGRGRDGPVRGARSVY